MRVLYFSGGNISHDINAREIDNDTLAWIDIEAPELSNELEHVARLYGMPHLARLDCLKPAKQPKFQQHNGHAFIIVHVPNPLEAEIATRKVALYIGRNFLVTTHRANLPVLDDFFERTWKNPEYSFSRGIDYLACLIVSALCLDYVAKIDRYSQEVMEIEERVIADIHYNPLSRVIPMKHQLAQLGRTASLQSETIEPLALSPAVQDQNEANFRALLDHMVRIISQVATLKEALKDILDAYQANKDKELNNTMKLMTIISTVFLPLNLLAGMAGMNMPIPGMDSPMAFWVVLGSMLLASAGLLWIFRRKNWI